MRKYRYAYFLKPRLIENGLGLMRPAGLSFARLDERPALSAAGSRTRLILDSTIEKTKDSKKRRGVYSASFWCLFGKQLGLHHAANSSHSTHTAHS
ncbi:MAG: hypothetical protein KOO69_05495, partial [Victivallales bacterium]|nr:hypothetical protein [Victivallales bacterium]